MDSFISLPIKERALIFNEAAIRHGKMSAKVLEKDFWVCWVLKRLFEIPKISKHLTFKGGTSLSKVYSLIDRFSEDVDLTIDRNYLGINTDNLLQIESSRKARQELRKKLDNSCIKFLTEELLPLLKKQFSISLVHNDWNVGIDINDPLTILFQYPRSISYGMGDITDKEFSYIKPVIRLEFGARGENFPTEVHTISSYIGNILPEIFDNTEEVMVGVNVLGAERTFWEKVIILHDLYYKEKPLKHAMARHYYDVVMIIRKGVIAQSIKKWELFEAVVRSSRLNCTDSNESPIFKGYDGLLKQNIKLIPLGERIYNLEKDYTNMQENGMFFGDLLSFNEILNCEFVN